MTQSSTTAAHRLAAMKPGDERNQDDAEPTHPTAEQHTAARASAGWRYGSALAAARALNARPARA